MASNMADRAHQLEQDLKGLRLPVESTFHGPNYYGAYLWTDKDAYGANKEMGKTLPGQPRMGRKPIELKWYIKIHKEGPHESLHYGYQHDRQSFDELEVLLESIDDYTPALESIHEEVNEKYKKAKASNFLFVLTSSGRKYVKEKGVEEELKQNNELPTAASFRERIIAKYKLGR